VGEKRIACRILEGNLGSDALDDVYGSVGLKLTLAKGDGRVLTGFTRHVIGTGGGLLLRRR
jgi:hypothetical protein